MKKMNWNLLPLLFLGLTVTLSNCKKKGDDPEPDPDPGCTYLLTEESIVFVDSTNGNAQSTGTLTYTYNSSKKLVKVTKASDGSVYGYDTVLYTSGGEIDSIKSYTAGGVLEVTKEYTYTGGRITMIKEDALGTSPYTRTMTYTYNGSGQLTDMVADYQVGNFDDEEIESITGITYTGGNITSGDVDMYGSPVDPSAAPVTLEYETTAPNPYLGITIEPDRILEMFSANNATKGYLDATPSTSLFEYSYTYENGRVKTISSGKVADYSEVKTLTYECK